MVRVFRERIPSLELKSLRIVHSTARFTNFYIDPVIRCFLSCVKLTILPHFNPPLSFIPLIMAILGLFNKGKLRIKNEGKGKFLSIKEIHIK